MGLSSAAQSFQRLLDHVLEGLDHVFCYLNDIMVYNEDEESHLKTVEEVFKRLEGAGLSIAPDKCKFGKQSIDYLGYEVSSSGIKPLPRKVAAIQDLPTPTKQKELLHYLGAVNYFRSSLGYLPTKGASPGRRRRSFGCTFCVIHIVSY